MRAKIHAHMLALMKPYGFLGVLHLFSGPFEEIFFLTHSQSHFSAHTVWLFRCGTFGKHKPKVPGIREQRTM